MRGFVEDNVALGEDTKVYTDASFGYRNLPNQEGVKYSVTNMSLRKCHWALAKQKRKKYLWEAMRMLFAIVKINS